MGVHVSSIVNEVIRTIRFLRKNFERTKTQIKQKRTNKTKTSEQKPTKATVFGAQKLLRGRGSLLKKIWDCPDNLILLCYSNQ